MSIPGLTLIGETINDSVPRTKELFEKGDLAGIQAVAAEQADRGARYIDVNVGRRGAGFMAEVVRKVQEAVSVPLSIDSPDFELIKAGLEAYDPEKGGGKPIINSISALRTELFDLVKEIPCRVILLVTERKTEGGGKACETAREAFDTARGLFEKAAGCGLGEDDVIFDPGIAPIGADTEGRFKRTIETLKLIHADPLLGRCHASVGLSNFTVMLPKRRPNGDPVRSSLESAFLTLAMPLGLDTIIGSVKRKYRICEEDDEALVCLKEILELEGFDALTRLDRFCRG